MTKTPKKPGCVGCEACRRTRRDVEIILPVVARLRLKALARKPYGFGITQWSADLVTIYRVAKRIAARGKEQR